MGLNAKGFYYSHELFAVHGITFPTNLKMLEFGNMVLPKRGLINPFMITHGGVKNSSDRTVKAYFESRGFKHTSIDINGAYGALSLDLRYPLPKEFHNQFDVATNFGTIEHIIDNQYQVFKNLHVAAKIGALIIHQLPFNNYGHGYWSYPESFFEIMSAYSGYRIIDLRITWMRYQHPMGYKRVIYVGLVKEQDREFISEKKWQEPIVDNLGYRKCGKEQYDNWIEDNRKGK